LKIVASDDNSFAENEFSTRLWHTDEVYQYAVFMRSYKLCALHGNQFMGNLFQSNKNRQRCTSSKAGSQAATRLMARFSPKTASAINRKPGH
jgi:hypothetical protein